MMAMAYGANKAFRNDFEQAWVGAYSLWYRRHEVKHMGLRLY